uniref:Uncharacterized protein n=1 Tax=Ananas comosus var. bracteatus TaxID=296719 RepID=A0A6V7PW48_ANACO|nr:unnamed protein product [Ananas comosus var. bracteatus]
MGQNGRLNGLDKFHSAFQQVWKSKNEFQRCWNGFGVDRHEAEPKWSENSILELLYRYKGDGCTGTTITALGIQALLSAPNLDGPLSDNIAKHWKANEAEAVEISKAMNYLNGILLRFIQSDFFLSQILYSKEVKAHLSQVAGGNNSNDSSPNNYFSNASHELGGNEIISGLNRLYVITCLLPVEAV